MKYGSETVVFPSGTQHVEPPLLNIDNPDVIQNAHENKHPDRNTSNGPFPNPLPHSHPGMPALWPLIEILFKTRKEGNSRKIEIDDQ